MRKEYGKAVRDLFQAQMATVLPDFEPVKVSSMYLFPGERPFRRVIDDSLHLWIILCPNLQGHEKFTVELGWSRMGRFPELSVRPLMPEDEPCRIYEQSEYVQRLGPLWKGLDFWWNLPKRPELGKIPAPEARELVRTQVIEAVEQAGALSPAFFAPLREVAA